MAKGSYYDKDAADYAVNFIECLCHTKGTRAHKPFKLIPWQEQIIRDIFGILDCDVKVVEFEETGRTVLRVIVPDKNNRFPDEPGCEYPYTIQLWPTDFLIPVDKDRPVS